MNNLNLSWIGVDLDGTLAYHEEGYHAAGIIGEPIPAMLEFVQKQLREGKTIKIFTCRAADPADVQAVKTWLRLYGLPDLEVTDRKDKNMTVCYDDNCIRVLKNTGRFVLSDEQREKEIGSSWEAFQRLTQGE